MLPSNKSVQMIQVAQYFQSPLVATTEESKQKYYTPISEKLMDPRIIPKAYWSFWKKF